MEICGLFMRMSFFSALAGVFLLVMPAYGADYADAFKKIAAGSAVLVDVRESSETKSGMIEGAVWLATSDIDGATETYRRVLATLAKDKTIYTYCAAGVRAGKFTKALLEKGYRSENLGGYSELVAAGAKVTK